jgi:hypothetical protein
VSGAAVTEKAAAAARGGPSRRHPLDAQQASHPNELRNSPTVQECRAVRADPIRSSSMVRRARKPPIVLASCCVEQYAIRDRSIRFSGHRHLFDGEEVGAVPRLAIGRYRDQSLLVLHCDGRWNVVAIDGPYTTLRDAKQGAERSYSGISAAWKRTGYSRAQAERRLARMGPKCSMCSRIWLDVEKMVEIKKRKTILCDTCIRELHERISPA